MILDFLCAAKAAQKVGGNTVPRPLVLVELALELHNTVQTLPSILGVPKMTLHMTLYFSRPFSTILDNSTEQPHRSPQDRWHS